MIAYASRTGTRRNLAALRYAGWRLLISAKGALRTEGMRYALDNGAWSAHQAGEPFDARAFEQALMLLGEGADWIVIPDVVAGGLDSLRFSLDWLPRLVPLGVPLLDGARRQPDLLAVEQAGQSGTEETKAGRILAPAAEWCECETHRTRYRPASSPGAD